MVEIGTVRTAKKTQTRHKDLSANRVMFSPLDLKPRQAMANPLPLRRVLRIRLDSNPSPPRLGIQIPQLDTTHRGLWSRSAPMGANMVGNIRVRPIPPMGRKLCLRSIGLTKSLVMARCHGCTAGSRVRHDPATDTHTYAYLFHVTCFAGYWLCGDYLRQGVCAE